MGRAKNCRCEHLSGNMPTAKYCYAPILALSAPAKVFVAQSLDLTPFESAGETCFQEILAQAVVLSSTLLSRIFLKRG